MAVTADDCHPRQRDAELRADDVHYALVGGIHIKQRNSEVAAIFLQGLNLGGSDWVGDGEAARSGWDIVIDSGHRAQRLAHGASIGA